MNPKIFNDVSALRLALGLARRGHGMTSPNPMVGAVLVKGNKIIGRGWHRRAGLPHAEIEALHDARKRGNNPKGSTLYVTLEPCSTHGRTPPCTDAIIAAGIKCVVVGTMDPNPKHSGQAFKILKLAGIEVVGSTRCDDRTAQRAVPAELANECAQLNEAFNHWIVHRTPLVTVKAAMTLDGKIATAKGESKWITGEKARAHAMRLRRGADAILVGINTILSDDSSLTVRALQSSKFKVQCPKGVRRVILDSMARTPLTAKVVSDEFAALTTIVVSKHAPKNQVVALAKRVNVIVAATAKVGRASSRAGSSSASPRRPIDLPWLLKKLGSENVTSLLVEGGGEVNASFLLGGFAHRVVFFYAPRIVGGRDSLKAVGGEGVRNLADALQLRETEWKKIGEDLMMTARVA